MTWITARTAAATAIATAARTAIRTITRTTIRTTARTAAATTIRTTARTTTAKRCACLDQASENRMLFGKLNTRKTEGRPGTRDGFSTYNSSKTNKQAENNVVYNQYGTVGAVSG